MQAGGAKPSRRTRKARAAVEADPGVRALVQRAEQVFGSPVAIDRGGKDGKGSVTVTNVSGVTDYAGLVNKMNNPATQGWYLEFLETGERNVGQAALLGGILSFTTYVPSEDPCTFEGTSNLYALYYKTGTGYKKDIIGSVGVDGGKRSLTKLPLGKGLARTPTIHMGRQEGSKAFVQLSTGDIVTIDEVNPLNPKSGLTSWKEVKYPMCQ